MPVNQSTKLLSNIGALVRVPNKKEQKYQVEPVGILGLCIPYQPNHHLWIGSEDKQAKLLHRSNLCKGKCMHNEQH